MFKKITTVAVLSSAIIFGGASLHSVDASAQSQSQSQPYKIYYSTNFSWNNVGQDNDFSNMFNKYFSWFHTSDHVTDNGEQKNQTQKAPAKQNDNQQKPAKQNTQKQVQQKPAKQQSQQAEKQPAKQQTTENKNQSASSKVPGLSDYEQQVVDLTNQEREKQGLKPLKADLELSRVAREKSHDMAVNGYFSHNSPTYGSPFDMMKSWGITYNTAGENIAKGQKTPQEVVNAWMNSEGHRANILNASFTKIGVGFSSQGNIWTQQFIG